ncbi:glycoside hydrolase family 19 protein [Collimonas pratensis]|uniref:Chitinase class I family protein n=1 Tax=Collimonas pratensis TaxID=279113 RepID=A0ABM5Z957_9BURK|nr:glycoside hydrolase family 19 protein [Collimonas pratensis]AMP15474.1 chitinase class I family protein [Collimonas pratensis]
MILTATQLSTALLIPLARAADWLAPINAALVEFGISSPARTAAFIAQIGHESGGLSRTSESFDYSVQGLVATFGKRIAANAATLGRQPGERAVPIDRQIRIANIVYASRYGNGDAATGDGWRYRGGGLKQITFHDNYAACSAALGVNLLVQPELLVTDRKLAARSAGWFWLSINGNAYADRGDFDGLSTRINGAGITVDSLAARRARWKSCKAALGIA